MRNLLLSCWSGETNRFPTQCRLQLIPSVFPQNLKITSLFFKRSHTSETGLAKNPNWIWPGSLLYDFSDYLKVLCKLPTDKINQSSTVMPTNHMTSIARHPQRCKGSTHNLRVANSHLFRLRPTQQKAIHPRSCKHRHLPMTGKAMKPRGEHTIYSFFSKAV